MIDEACLAGLRAKVKRLTRRATALSAPTVARVPGRGSIGPWSLTPRDWIGALARTIRHSAHEDYGIAAGAIAFSSFLALLPLLALVALAYGRFTAPEQVIENVRALIRILPGSARDFVGDWLVETLTKREGRGAGLLLSAAVTLYGATRGGRSIIAALNIACGLDRRRGFLARRVLALAIVLGGGSLLLSALFAISGLAFVERYLPEHTPYVIHALRLAFWIIVTLGAGGALAIIYRHAPAREPPSWRWVAPGALAATGLWLVTTLAFGFYLGSFGSYQQSYGSIGAVVVLQLWLFLSAFILMLGARLNVEAEACLFPDEA